MDFCKNPTFTCIFLDFLEKSIFFREFFWIFDIRIGKINLFPRFFFGFLQKSIFSLGFFTFFWKIHLFPWVFYFFWKIHLFPWVFLDFWLGNPKIQTPFRRIQKNPKKPWEIQKSIFLTWIQRFCLKRWIFGFLVEQSSEIQDFIFWTWIQVF